MNYVRNHVAGVLLLQCVANPQKLHREPECTPLSSDCKKLTVLCSPLGCLGNKTCTVLIHECIACYFCIAIIDILKSLEIGTYMYPDNKTITWHPNGPSTTRYIYVSEMNELKTNEKTNLKLSSKQTKLSSIHSCIVPFTTYVKVLKNIDQSNTESKDSYHALSSWCTNHATSLSCLRIILEDPDTYKGLTIITNIVANDSLGASLTCATPKYRQYVREIESYKATLHRKHSAKEKRKWKK